MPDTTTTAPAAARIAAPLGVLAGVAAAFAYVGTVDPNVPGHYPVCPLLHYTGLYCPGCGGLRSAYAVVHGEFGTALGANALAVAAYGLFALLWTLWLVRAARGRRFAVTGRCTRAADPTPVVHQPVRLRPAYWWAIGAVVMAFTIVRNLPFGSVLAP